MQPQAGGGREAVAADGAEVGSLAGVDGQVPLQLVFVQESPAAHGAGLRLLSFVRAHVFCQLHQSGEGVVAASARVRPLLLELPVSEAVLLEFFLLLKGFNTAAALVRSLFSMSPEVIFQSSQLQEDAVTMWASRFSSIMDHNVLLIVRELKEVFAAHRTVIFIVLVNQLVLLQSVLDLKFLPTGAAGVRLLMDHHVSLQFFRAAKRLLTFRTGAAVLFDVNLQVLVEVFWEGKVLLAIRAGVTLGLGSFTMGHNVPF